jgi:hypothetical protein
VATFLVAVVVGIARSSNPFQALVDLIPEACFAKGADMLLRASGVQQNWVLVLVPALGQGRGGHVSELEVFSSRGSLVCFELIVFGVRVLGGVVVEDKGVAFPVGAWRQLYLK